MNETPAPSDRKPMGVLRWIFAIIGVLIMAFCGGCMLLFADAGMTAVTIGGLPFLLGLLVWGLAVFAGRK